MGTRKSSSMITGITAGARLDKLYSATQLSDTLPRSIFSMYDLVKKTTHTAERRMPSTIAASMLS